MKLLKIVIPCFFLYFFIWLAIVRTDGFRTDLITRFKFYEKKWDISLDEKDLLEIQDILSQKFYYITRGRECFIFQSEDRKYILKFFNSFRYNTKYFFPNIILPEFLERHRKKHYNRRRTKLAFNLSSTKLAFENLKDDAALKYVHTSKKDVFKKKIEIVNKYKKNFCLDLNDIFFVLQKKCDMFYSCYENSKDEKYKMDLLMTFLQMVHNRTKKLIIDDDIGKKRRNWGLYDNKAVTIDIGRWYFDEKLKTPDGYKKEMLKATKIFRKYLQENDLDKLKIVNQKLENYFENFNKKYYEKCFENQAIAK